MSRSRFPPSGLRRAASLPARNAALPPMLDPMPRDAREFLDRDARQATRAVDPVPLDRVKPTQAPPRPVASVNSANVTQRILTLTTTGILGQEGTPLIEADPNRRYLEIANLDGAAVVTLGFNSQPQANLGRPIAAGGIYSPDVVPTSAIYAIASITGTRVLVLYG